MNQASLKNLGDAEKCRPEKDSNAAACAEDDRNNRLRMACPFCGGFFRIRTSHKVSSTTIRAMGECQECTYRGHLDISHVSIAFPSDHPDAMKAAVYLPVTDYVKEWAGKKQMEKFKADMFGDDIQENQEELARLNYFQARLYNMGRNDMLKLATIAEELQVIPARKT
ncbi:hypothetical protein LMG33818_002648 [Halomonadaceae bacterium LMG 33818]|uniref:hypothetical protein n=1 Tax=Cernens ardua TaxID=3402176 RepID=UPI003EDBA35F